MLLNQLSTLDTWSMKRYGVSANDLSHLPGQSDQLTTQIMKLCDSDVEFWKPRDERMLNAQKLWEIGKRKGGSLQSNITKAGRLNSQDMIDDAQNAEVLEFNDGYLIVDKLTSMVASAQWHVEVPPMSNELREAAQHIEDFLAWAEEEMNAKHGLALNGTIIRDEAHYAALRGWITGLIIPNPFDQKLPWQYILEDPLFVYPRYGQDGLIRVTHRYTITALEAADKFPEALQFFADKDDDDTVEVTSYYDAKYKITMVSEGVVSRAKSQGINKMVVEPLQPHGYVDFDGRPINPWIIVTPRGTPTRRSLREHDKDSVAMIGLDVLHPVKDMILYMEKLASMMMTEVAKGQNPPHVVYHQPGQKPERVDFGIGTENYLLIDEQRVDMLATTAMKPDARPLMELILDRLQRGSVSSVLFGSAAASLSGFAVNLLSKGAQDVLEPLMNGVKLYRQLRFRRILEMYMHHGSKMTGPLQYRSVSRNSGQALTGAQFDPQLLQLNGVYVDVSYDSVLPADRAQLMMSAVAGTNSGLLSRYDARKDWLGVPNPKQTELRILEEMNYQDPDMIQEMRMMAAERSGDPFLVEAVQRVQQKQMMLMQMQLEQARVQGGMDQPTQLMSGGMMEPPTTESLRPQSTRKVNPQVSSDIVPPDQQPGSTQTPAGLSPMNAALDQMNNVSAAMNTSNGGTPPLPMVQ